MLKRKNITEDAGNDDTDNLLIEQNENAQLEEQFATDSSSIKIDAEPQNELSITTALLPSNQLSGDIDILFVIKQMLRLGAPLVIADLIESAGTFVINFIVVKSDTNAAGALSLIGATKSIALTTGGALLGPLSAMIARQYGENDKYLAGTLLQQGWLLGTVVSIPIMAGLWNVAPILQLFKQPPHLIPLVSSYFVPFAFAVPIKLSLLADFYFLPAVDRQLALIPWTLLVIGTGVGINYLLAHALGFGLKGAGYAVLVEALVSRLSLSLYYGISSDFSEYKLFDLRLREGFVQLKKILNLGYPIALLSTALVTTSFLQTMMIGWLGEDRLAIEQASAQYMILFGPFMTGITRASGIYVSQLFGNRLYSHIRKYANTAFILQAAIETIPLIAFITMPMQLAEWFLGDNNKVDLEEMEITIRATFVIHVLSQILNGIANTAIASLQGLYDTLFPSIANLVVALSVMLPLPYVLAFVAKGDLIGLNGAISFGYAVNAGIMLYRWYKKSSLDNLIELAQMQEEAKQQQEKSLADQFVTDTNTETNQQQYISVDEEFESEEKVDVPKKLTYFFSNADSRDSDLMAKTLEEPAIDEAAKILTSSTINTEHRL